MSVRTIRNEKALQHLRNLKPYDGWSIDTYTSSVGRELVMLRRRNVPLYKKGFECVIYDDLDTQCVVGITSFIGDTDNNQFCRGIVLVDKNGVVTRDQKEVRITLKKNKVDIAKKGKEINQARPVKKQNLKESRASSRSGKTRNPNSNPQNSAALQNLPNDQTSELARLGLILIGILTILRILSSLFFSVYVLVVPLVVLYGLSNCPSNESFDAKKELKRVLRGHHLPSNHPDKPKEDWLSNTIARVTASVATELATSLGYELSFFVSTIPSCLILEYI